MVQVKPARTVDDPGGLSAAEVQRLTGVSYRRLDHWATRGYIGGGNPGLGYERRFGSRDVALISYVMRLTEAGLLVEPAVKVANELIDTGQPVPLAGGLMFCVPDGRIPELVAVVDGEPARFQRTSYDRVLTEFDLLDEGEEPR